MKKRLRRNTEITDVNYEWKRVGAFTVGTALATTNNGVGIMTFTIKSKLEPKNNQNLAVKVMRGRLHKALEQYRKGGRVNVKLTTLIPTKSM